MTVKKPMPCSLYDMEGIQNWLDKMARQGLFLDRIAFHNDRFIFQTGEPGPARYRLDPIVPGYDYGERRELYAQAGWEFVDTMVNLYCVYSCADPDVPELYSDPQSLACAVGRLAKRRSLSVGLLLLVLAFAVGGFCFVGWDTFLRNLILREEPFFPLTFLALPVLLVICGVIEVVYVRRLWTVCRTLEQSLSLKSGRRWNRPRFLTVYIPIFILGNLLINYVALYSPETTYTYDPAALARPWPTAAQIEQTVPGQVPEDWTPCVDGYLRKNASRRAPVQEFVSRRQTAGSDYPYSLSTTIRYVRADSPKTAGRLYRLERDERAKRLEQWKGPTFAARVTDLVPFSPRDWPGLDRLEVAQFRSGGQAGWTFALLRGNDVLLVSYTGPARWEGCLPLFLEALDS